MTDDEALALARHRTAGRIVRGAVHDFRNAIGSVSGNLEWVTGWREDEQRLLTALEGALGAYAEPGDLQRRASELIDKGRADRQEALEVFDECAMGLQLGLKASLGLSLPAQERENVGRWPLAQVLEEAHQSATLFGRNVASWNVAVVDGPMLEGDVAVWRLLLIALVLDPLERLKDADRRGAVSVRFEAGLVIEDDGPDGPIPWAAHVAADRLGVSVSRQGGRTVLSL